MGGHTVARTDDTFRAAAELGASVTAAGRTVLTGGGPGAMEAANPGALQVRGRTHSTRH